MILFLTLHRYLDQLVEENKRLTNLVSALATPPAETPGGPSTSGNTPRADNADLNPLVEEQAWFVSLDASDLPIHIGDAADAAFATRFRQALTSQPVNHIPRTHYLDDDSLRALSEQSPEWPSASRLRFLVDVALKTISKRWHIVRPSNVLSSVEKLLKDHSSCHWLTQCKLWALMAIGEAFSSRCTLPDSPFPGAKYWTKAKTVIRIAPERPQLEVVEIYLLLVWLASFD